jgi:hypothetical protein
MPVEISAHPSTSAVAKVIAKAVGGRVSEPRLSTDPDAVPSSVKTWLGQHVADVYDHSGSHGHAIYIQLEGRAATPAAKEHIVGALERSYPTVTFSIDNLG